jgi:two-component system, chemotaxis family, CheB/CheR fusion protein
MAKKKNRATRKPRSNSSRRKPPAHVAPDATTNTPDVADAEPAASTAASSRIPLTIVGIGASAGGVEAMTKLVQHLAPDSGLAYVLVQHLAPRHESFLPELLRSSSRVRVVQAEERMAIEPNRLHVIPPNAHMTIVNGHLHLAPRPLDRTQYNPIDSFFQSLAAHAEHRAVGVVLSGSASDGAAGLSEIKGAGGLTFVQDPKTAAYDSMPRAAIATGAADFVLSPEAIAEELGRLGKHPFLAPTTAEVTNANELQLTDLQLERLFYLLRAASGVDFTYYKLPTIKRRLQRRMALHKITEVDTYVKLVERDPTEVRGLYRDILIHVTRFFRDPESFDALKEVVFPRIVNDAAARRPIRIWVPGCATGEEAYSIAIALLEFLGNDATSAPVQVFATDVSEDAIERARMGLYPESISADVSHERLRRYFTRADGQYRISKIVRDSCIFARQDLTRDPPFSKLDLIVCRNVLIYLGQRLQRKLMAVFHYALKPAGFLMLGTTETVSAHAELFAVQDKRNKIYTKRNGRPRGDVDFSPMLGHTFERENGERPAQTAHVPGPRPGDLQTEVNRLVLARYSPPSVVVDNELQIVQTRGRTGPFLELASGDASLNLLKMAREGILHGLRSAVQESRRTGKAARRDGLVLKNNGSTREVNVQVFPFIDANDSPFFLVLFEDGMRVAPAVAPATTNNRKKKKKEDPRILRLQQELTSSREYLQSIIQDLEAANEELQSANEEILSSNEELQSTNEELDTAKEELQSTNEELNTVNEELNARNEELSQVNADLINLLSAVPAAVVIVTADLRIRRFTPLAEQVLNLIPTDIGRPLGDLKPNIEAPDLEVLTREVIDSVTPKELEVRDRRARSYVLRIRPYKDQENRIDGAVLAFADGPRSSSHG